MNAGVNQRSSTACEMAPCRRRAPCRSARSSCPAGRCAPRCWRARVVEPLRRMDAEPHARHAAQRQAAEMRALDAQRVEHADDVAAETLDGVGPGVAVECRARACRSARRGTCARARRSGGPTSRGRCRANWRARAPARRQRRRRGSEFARRRRRRRIGCIRAACRCRRRRAARRQHAFDEGAGDAGVVARIEQALEILRRQVRADRGVRVEHGEQRTSLVDASRHARSTSSCAGCGRCARRAPSPRPRPGLRPWVSSRLAAILAASTSRPCDRAGSCGRARRPPACRSPGSVSHSACQPPRPRSCSCTIADSIVGHQCRHALCRRQHDRGARRDCACAAASTSRRGLAPRARTLRRLRSASAATCRARSCPACRRRGPASSRLRRCGRGACATARRATRGRVPSPAPARPSSPCVAQRSQRARGAAELQHGDARTQVVRCARDAVRPRSARRRP